MGGFPDGDIVVRVRQGAESALFHFFLVGVLVLLGDLHVVTNVAEHALQLALTHGAAAPGLCAASTSSVLKQLSGFESISRTFFPKRLMDDFESLPGVTTRRLFEDDDDDKSVAISQFERGLPAVE